MVRRNTPSGGGVSFFRLAFSAVGSLVRRFLWQNVGKWGIRKVARWNFTATRESVSVFRKMAMEKVLFTWDASFWRWVGYIFLFVYRRVTDSERFETLVCLVQRIFEVAHNERYVPYTHMYIYTQKYWLKLTYLQSSHVKSTCYKSKGIVLLQTTFEDQSKVSNEKWFLQRRHWMFICFSPFFLWNKKGVVHTVDSWNPSPVEIGSLCHK